MHVSTCTFPEDKGEIFFSKSNVHLLILALICYNLSFNILSKCLNEKTRLILIAWSVRAVLASLWNIQAMKILKCKIYRPNISKNSDSEILNIQMYFRVLFVQLNDYNNCKNMIPVIQYHMFSSILINYRKQIIYLYIGYIHLKNNNIKCRE